MAGLAGQPEIKGEKMPRLRENLRPDEMMENPLESEGALWISPNENIITIGTPEGPRYIRDNRALIQSPTGMQEEKYISVNPNELSMDEGQTLGRMMPPGPPPPPIAYATNIPDTANRWAKEGKIGQEGQNNFSFLTNTPEETVEAKQKGYGKWGKIIGPPEAGITSTKPKEKSPFPGAPPSENDLTDLKHFDKFLGHLDQQGFLKKSDLNLNPVDTRKAAEQPLKDQNAQFLYDYETYGAKQMGADSTARYNRLQKQIKEAGDLAEEGAKNAHTIARQNQGLALDFFKAHRKDLAEKGKMSKEDQQELISIQQEKTALRRDTQNIMLSDQDQKDAKDQLGRLEDREKQLLKKEGGSQAQPGGKQRSISKGLDFMKGTTDKNEIMKKANILKTQYGWSKEELNRLGQELGF